MAREENSMRDTGRRVRGRSSGRFAAFWVLVLVTAVGVVLSLTVFFKIATVHVEGQYTVYTEEEILEAAGIELGSNLLRLPVGEVRQRLETQLPYLLGVTVERRLPDTVVITVNNVDTELALPYKGGCLILSDTMKILEDVSALPEGSPVVYGLTPSAFSPGSQLEVEQEGGTMYLETLVSAAREAGLLTGITALNVADKLNLCLVFDGRVFVVLGTANEIEYKFRMMDRVLTEEGKSAVGTLDVSMPGKAYFREGTPEIPDSFYTMGEQESMPLAPAPQPGEGEADDPEQTDVFDQGDDSAEDPEAADGA